MIETPPPFNGFPRKENCDLENPYEAFLWMLVALPAQHGGPLVMPIQYLQLVSKRLWDLGARPVEAPTLQWVAPTGSEPRWMTTPGKWVPAGSVLERSPEEQAQDAVGRMTMQQKAELLEALTAWSRGMDIPQTPAGLVASSLSDDQKGVVLRVLEVERDSA